jgi:Tfp pilus assembly protein PilF
MLQAAITSFEKAHLEQPANAGYWHFWADTYHRIGIVLMVEGRRDEGEQACRQAVAIHDKRAAELPGPPYDPGEVAVAYMDLGKLLAAKGEITEAEQVYSKGIERAPQAWLSWCARAHFYHRQHELEKAEKDLASAASTATDASDRNSMAWSLLSNPDRSFRHPQVAVELAERAIAARPADGMIWNTVGIARYRNGEWKEAAAALDKSMALRNGGDAGDWFFVAMCHWQLGEKDEARKWYEKATQWTEKNQPKNVELRRFRAEAEELLRIAETQPTTKKAN